MFVLRALHSFVATLGDRKPNNRVISSPTLRRLQMTLVRLPVTMEGCKRGTTPEGTDIITININRRWSLSQSQHLKTSCIDIILKVLKVDLRLLMRLPFLSDLACSSSSLE